MEAAIDRIMMTYDLLLNRSAAASAEADARSGPSTALVLADRAMVIRRRLEEAYPVTRKTRVTYSGRGYGAGYAQGQRADIGNARLGQTRAISRA